MVAKVARAERTATAEANPARKLVNA